MTANCREYCRYSRYCHKAGEPGLDPDDCPAAWRIEDNDQELQACEGCHNPFHLDEMIETEFGYFCHNCFKDRMEIEDRNINE